MRKGGLHGVARLKEKFDVCEPRAGGVLLGGPRGGKSGHGTRLRPREPINPPLHPLSLTHTHTQLMDRDRDGVLSYDEAKQALRAYGNATLPLPLVFKPNSLAFRSLLKCRVACIAPRHSHTTPQNLDLHRRHSAGGGTRPGNQGWFDPFSILHRFLQSPTPHTAAAAVSTRKNPTYPTTPAYNQ